MLKDTAAHTKKDDALATLNLGGKGGGKNLLYFSRELGETYVLQWAVIFHGLCDVQTKVEWGVLFGFAPLWLGRSVSRKNFGG